jgi:hypothetical protein
MMASGKWNDAVPLGMDHAADRVSRFGLVAGMASFAVLVGLFATALIRDYSDAYTVFDGLITAGVGTGVVIAVLRRRRRFH